MTTQIKPKQQTQLDEVIQKIQQMDIDSVSALVEQNPVNPDDPLDRFIPHLRIAIHQFILAGDSELHCYSGYCGETSCNHLCSGYSFIGNQSGMHMDIIFSIKNGFIDSISDCAGFVNVISPEIKGERVRVEPPLDINKSLGLKD